MQAVAGGKDGPHGGRTAATTTLMLDVGGGGGGGAGLAADDGDEDHAVAQVTQVYGNTPLMTHLHCNANGAGLSPNESPTTLRVVGC